MEKNMENSMKGSQKKKIELPYDLVISVLGTCPKEMKALTQNGISIPMSTAVLLIIAKT